MRSPGGSSVCDRYSHLSSPQTVSVDLRKQAEETQQITSQGTGPGRVALDQQDIVPDFSQVGYPQDIVPQQQVIGPQEIVPGVVLSAVSAALGTGHRG